MLANIAAAVSRTSSMRGIGRISGQVAVTMFPLATNDIRFMNDTIGSFYY